MRARITCALDADPAGDRPSKRRAIIGELDRDVRIEHHVRNQLGRCHVGDDSHAKACPAIGFDAQDQHA
ncbi:hypothetical protein DA075_21945 [Methylobacterium currus]|uniref:Uncharacterized protein n=1 Tax=Methylobacterium currus TaxID=2051553 RepID=A0A2R4WNY8_9HYPH|nr:hypothetical protein [Methylobacterium currus]AWB23233.1 hypothetical protein DA075_21945 [Methylobacterium currus]